MWRAGRSTFGYNRCQVLFLKVDQVLKKIAQKHFNVFYKSEYVRDRRVGLGLVIVYETLPLKVHRLHLPYSGILPTS